MFNLEAGNTPLKSGFGDKPSLTRQLRVLKRCKEEALNHKHC